MMRALNIEQDSPIDWSQLSGTVLTPAENTRDLYEIMKMQAGAGATSMAKAAFTRVEIELCYCSIYEDCWSSKFAQGKESKHPVAQCPNSDASDFTQ
jgi:hypothetical protein